jgi:DNA-binding beta-propeller fold protein YncE
MKALIRTLVLIIACLTDVSVLVAGRGDTARLMLRATYDTGLLANGAEVISVRHTDGIAALTNVVGSVDVIDLSDPLDPRLRLRIDVDVTAGTPNSVAVHPQHDYLLVVTGRPGMTGAVTAYRLSDGALLATAAVGIQPDAIAIAPNGQYAVVANEAEAAGANDSGGAGSLSIVDLTGFNGVVVAPLKVTTIALPSLAGVVGASSGRTDDIARLAIDNEPDSLEPEYVAFSHDSRFA